MITKKEPSLSVIMGVYNGQPFLSKAIESILNQTFTDFEFIICDDCSTDDSAKILREFAAKDSRIRLLQNKQNKGLAATLNNCLNIPRGTFIARMDCDDISLPERFAKQKEWLEKHEKVWAVGTSVEFIDDYGQVYGHTSNLVERFYELKDTVFGCVLIHPSVMMRADILRSVGGYSVNVLTTRAEDYDLWCKLCEKGGQLANMSEILLQYREDTSNITKRKYKYRVQEAKLKAYWIKRAGLPKICAFYAVRPLLIGLLPLKFYKRLHRERLTGR